MPTEGKFVLDANDLVVPLSQSQGPCICFFSFPQNDQWIHNALPFLPQVFEVSILTFQTNWACQTGLFLGYLDRSPECLFGHSVVCGACLDLVSMWSLDAPMKHLFILAGPHSNPVHYLVVPLKQLNSPSLELYVLCRESNLHPTTKTNTPGAFHLLVDLSTFWHVSQDLTNSSLSFQQPGQ